LAKSEISPNLIASYKAADYQAIVHTDAFTLHIDQYSASLHQLLIRSDHQCAVFITAFNPLSQPQNPQKNLTCNAQLRKVLTQHTHLVFEGASTDPSKLWPTEKSYLALGINLKTAMTLGKQFDQNAIVWIDTDAIPRLVLLR
jgi:uncharacterized protein DUF3293